MNSTIWRIFIWITALAISATSLAGHYSVSSMTGGRVYIIGPFGTEWNYAYTTTENVRTGSGESSEFFGEVGLVLGAGKVDCKEEIVATCTWNPAYAGEPPPRCPS